MTTIQRHPHTALAKGTPLRGVTAALFVLGAALGTGCGGGGSDPSGPVAPPAPGSLSYQAGVALALPGELVSVAAPSVTGTVDSWSISPALPAGLALSSVDGSIQGLPTEATGRVQYTVTASNASGSTSSKVVIDVAPPVRFALVTHQDEGVFGRYLVGGASGDLTHRGYVVQDAAQVAPSQLVLTPDGRFGFAANDGSNDLSSYSIDLDTGDLTLLGTTALSNGPFSLAIHPEGTALYVAAEGDARLESFAIDQVTGALASHGAALSTAVAPTDVDVSPNGDYLILSHATAAKLDSYALDPATAVPSFDSSYALAPGSPETTGLAIAPYGNHVYAVFGNLNLVGHFAAEAGTGALSLVGSGLSTAPDTRPRAVSVHPNGRHVYVLNEANQTMTRYAVDVDTGSLTRAESLALDTAADALTIEPGGRYGFLVEDDTHSCTRVEFDATSGLATLRTSVRTRRLPGPVTLLSGQGPLDLVAANLYVTNSGSDDVSLHSVASDGSLTALLPNAPTGDFPNGVAVDPRGRFAFVSNSADSTISRYLIEPDGSWTEMAPAQPCGPTPAAMVVDPSGRFLYLITRGNESVQVFRVETNGTLTLVESKSSGTQGSAIVVDPSGQYLYVAIQGNRTVGNSGRIDIYGIHPQDGTLDPRSTPGPAPGGPASLCFSRGGGMVYSALEKADHLAPYEVDGDDGLLTPLSPGSPTGDEPTDLWIHPSGLYAYVAVRQPSGFGRIDLFDVRPSDGALYDQSTNTLAARESFTFFANPSAITGTPDGRTVYALHPGISTVAVMRFDDGSVNPANVGHLQSLSSVAVGTDPRAIKLFSVLE